MNALRAARYLTFLTLPLTALWAFTHSGWWTYATALYAFGAVPLLELVLPARAQPLPPAEEERRARDWRYSALLYAVLPVQLACLGLFLSTHSAPWQTYELVGRVLSMGILCGTLGINVAHELGHRTRPYEQRIAQALLLTSLYTHFFIEHNRGHHRRVATAEDPASARFGESVFAFWVRSVVGGYLSAWRLEAERLRRRGLPVYHWSNQMAQFQVAQGLLLGILYAVGGWSLTLAFGAAALVGILLLETVNYIEHYGLSRQRVGARYERPQPWHSWNSEHALGRLLLFELSRHADHHHQAARPYQVLRHREEAPQMPTGYPGMMLLALVPPAWFWVMNPRVRRLGAAQPVG